jgi:eukaryotic-like serine/threonine-protein kinase
MSGIGEHDDALVGTTIAEKYRVDRLIGRGGMGAVFEATNVSIGKRVALKFLDREAARDHEAVMRFQREAETASAVESAHIVHIFDSGSSGDGRPFLVMELLTGEDLRSALKREERVPLDDALHITAQVLRALARAHAAGIVHRDLKPDNVFLCRRDDDPMFVKIVDFGISKITRAGATADTLTRRGSVLGTAFYMSPEQAQAFPDIDGRTDLFSVGAILFEALTGRPPHVGTVYEAVLIDICTKDAPDVREFAPEVPEAIADVIRRALQRDRDRRFESAADFYDALSQAAPGSLRSGGPGVFRASLSSGVEDTARIRPGSTPGAVVGRVVTAEGTSVRTRNDKTQTRRTIVAALVAALGASTLVVMLMAQRQHNAADARPEARPTASTPEGQVTVTPSTSAPEPEKAPDAGHGDAGPRASAAPSHPIKPPVATGKPPTSHAPDAGKTTVKPPPTGIATGLTLETKPP